MKKKLDRVALESLKQEGRLDKNDELFWKILHDEPLTETERLRVERYDYVISLRSNGYSKRLIAKQLELKYQISVTQSYVIIREATAIFGEQTLATKEGTKAIFLEKYERLEKIALDEKDYKLAKECVDAQAKIEGLYVHTQEPTILQFPTIILSPDPNALRNAVFEVEEIEEVEENRDETIEDATVSGGVPVPQAD
jgi:hypothetical protein